MKNNQFLAKSDPIETIQEHTDNLIKMFEQLKKIYCSKIKLLKWDLLYIACITHDLGKINPHFQNKLYKQINKRNKSTKYPLLETKTNKELPHGCISASLIHKKYLEQLSKEEKQILLWVVYYHHYRKNIDDVTVTDRNDILDNDITKFINQFEYDKLLYGLDINYGIRRYLDQKPAIEENQALYYQYVITKGFLNKIDYAASSHLDKIEINDFDLISYLNGYMKEKGYRLNKLQNYVKENTNKNLVIVASTGMGKTEAGLLWIGNDKGFFTLTLRVSINSIYKRILKQINYKNVGLLHSDTISEYINYNENKELDIDYFNKTKQLSLPLTVCTLDQIIDVVYKYPNYEFKLATFSYSKIIIDEIQMYSPDMLALLIIFLKQLSDVKGRFMIMTATLPDIFIYFMKKYKIPFDNPKLFASNKKRHKVKLIKHGINVDKIISSYHEEKKKILVIVNTVRKAQEIFTDLRNTKISLKEINLFHSRFIQNERNKKSTNIFNFGQLDNKEYGIWVTTQIVEASLDIDFDELHTELSDLSGFIQRMGRVYRKRVLLDDRINVFVYVGSSYKDISGIGSIINKEIFEISKENLINYNTKVLTEEDKFMLIQKTYSYDILKNTEYFKKIDQVINSYMYISDFIYEKSDVNIRNIDMINVIPTKVYKDNKKEINFIVDKISELKGKEKLVEKQQLINKVKGYTIQIQRRRLNNSNYVIEKGRIEITNYFKIYIVNYEYDNLLGLTFTINEEENLQERMF